MQIQSQSLTTRLHNRFVQAFPTCRNLSAEDVFEASGSAFMGALPGLGMGLHALGGLFSNRTPEGTAIAGMATNFAGSCALGCAFNAFSLGQTALGVAGSVGAALGLGLSGAIAFIESTDIGSDSGGDVGWGAHQPCHR